MIRKLLCFLGFHKWKRLEYTCNHIKMCPWYWDSGLIVCKECKDNIFVCKHCGKIKH